MTQFSTALAAKLQGIVANPEHQTLTTITTDRLVIELSRHYLSRSQLSDLSDWLESQGLIDKIQTLFTDNLLNFTEQRGVNHVFLRDTKQRFPCRQNSVLQDMAKHQQAFAEKFQRLEITGLKGQAITDLLTIGIGGSHLGADLVTDALRDYCQPGLNLHYLTGTDPYALQDILARLPAETTLVFVASKSWSTLETLLNFDKVRAWFFSQVGADHYPTVLAKQFFALTAHKAKAEAAGFAQEHIFELSDAVGGRFSLWSAVGLPMRLALGEAHFHALLEGAHAMDRHFKEQALADNIPLLLALLDLYYANRLGVQQRAVVCYTHRLRLLADHLQQLEMESNGKSVDERGNAVNYPTGLAVWGGVGPNSQHSFHQWFYQGTMLVPIDFIALKGTSSQPDFDRVLLSQCLAQAKALWEGQSLADLPQTPTDNTRAHRVISGKKPSTLILLKDINPGSLGELIAMYEHKVFMIGLLTATNAFDQFGVEAGKSQGTAMLQAMTDAAAFAQLDTVSQTILQAAERLC